jgi:hypothetical protein
MSRTATLALLAALAAGCGRNDKPVPGVKFDTPNPQEDARLKESLDAFEAALARHEEALRKARDAKLPLQTRYEMAEAGLAELDQLQKQYEGLIAQAESAVKSGGITRPRLDQFKAASESFDRLHKDWDAVLDANRAELRKLEKAQPKK